jgi:hypothetical protein
LVGTQGNLTVQGGNFICNMLRPEEEINNWCRQIAFDENAFSADLNANVSIAFDTGHP